MGPRSFNRGNDSRFALRIPSCAGLQWGRGLSTAEIGRWPWPSAPRLYASMGPRSFNRGNRTKKMVARIGLPGFNGAAVFQPRKWVDQYADVKEAHPLQWGRGLSTAEMSIRDVADIMGNCASMGPRSFNRGNSGRLKVVAYVPLASMGPRSFNRGNGLLGLDDGLLDPASMGPRSFNRGNIAAAKMAYIARLRASMGPRSFNRGNVVDPGQGRVGQVLLQWGRGLSTAEISQEEERGSPVKASMGPRSFNRGNGPASSFSSTAQPRLQWGRGLSTAEMPDVYGGYR